MKENVIIELKDWREVYTTQKPMLENAKEKDHKFYFTTDNEKTNGKMFGSCPDIDTFLSYYSALESKDKHFYEFLHGDSPVNEYYDIDLKSSQNITTFKDPENIFLRFNSIRNEFINECFPNSDILTDWRITDSSKFDKDLNVWKVSLHLVNRLNVFENNKITKRWYAMFETFMNDFYCGEEIFDKAVSSVYRSMRMVESTKIKDITRPLLGAKWHSKSNGTENIKEFYIQNADTKYKHACIRAIDKYSETQKLIKRSETKYQKDLIKFQKEPEVNIIEEEEDEVELLITLITNQITAKTHSLCDNSPSGVTDKITYKSFMNLCFAYLSTLTVNGKISDEEEVGNFITTEIYPFYRNSKEHTIDNILSSILKASTRNSSATPYTKASLHYWAREDFQTYKLHFGKPKIITTCGVFNDDKKFYFGNFIRHILRTTFDDYDQLLKYVVANFNKICLPVMLAKLTYYLKRENPTDVESYILDRTEELSYMCKFFGKKGLEEAKLKNVLNSVTDQLTEYNALTYRPFGKKEPFSNPEIFNTFMGMKTHLIEYDPTNEETKTSGCPLLIKHIREVICAGDENIFEYFITWMAHIIQYPEIKTKIMMILYSEKQQIGKGILAEMLINKIFGFINACKTNTINDIFGDFNSLLGNRIFVVIDELNGKDPATNSKIQKLKSRITDSSQTINAKGIDAEQVIDYTNFMMLTNEAGATKIETHDQRTCVLKVSEHKLGDIKYFKDLSAEIENDDACNAFYTYLWHYDTTKISLRNIPQTDQRAEMILQTAEQPIKFFNDIKQEYYKLEEPQLTRNDEGVFITLDSLYSSFLNWVIVNGEKTGIYSKLKFGKFCKSSFGDIVQSRAFNNGRARSVNINSIVPKEEHKNQTTKGESEGVSTQQISRGVAI